MEYKLITKPTGYKPKTLTKIENKKLHEGYIIVLKMLAIENKKHAKKTIDWRNKILDSVNVK